MSSITIAVRSANREDELVEFVVEGDAQYAKGVVKAEVTQWGLTDKATHLVTVGKETESENLGQDRIAVTLQKTTTENVVKRTVAWAVDNLKLVLHSHGIRAPRLAERDITRKGPRDYSQFEHNAELG